MQQKSNWRRYWDHAGFVALVLSFFGTGGLLFGVFFHPDAISAEFASSLEAILRPMQTWGGNLVGWLIDPLLALLWLGCWALSSLVSTGLVTCLIVYPLWLLTNSTENHSSDSKPTTLLTASI